MMRTPTVIVLYGTMGELKGQWQERRKPTFQPSCITTARIAMAVLSRLLRHHRQLRAHLPVQVLRAAHVRVVIKMRRVKLPEEISPTTQMQQNRILAAPKNRNRSHAAIAHCVRNVFQEARRITSAAPVSSPIASVPHASVLAVETEDPRSRTLLTIARRARLSEAFLRRQQVMRTLLLGI
jgi:hypothetical protein